MGRSDKKDYVNFTSRAAWVGSRSHWPRGMARLLARSRSMSVPAFAASPLLVHALLAAPVLVPAGKVVHVTPQVSEESSWSPDSARLAFDSNRAGGATKLFVMDVSGANLRQLTFGSGTDEAPAWSPDGSRIAFVSDRSGHAEIWLVGAHGHSCEILRVPAP
jgi:hypothetical protein